MQHQHGRHGHADRAEHHAHLGDRDATTATRPPRRRTRRPRRSVGPHALPFRRGRTVAWPPPPSRHRLPLVRTGPRTGAHRCRHAATRGRRAPVGRRGRPGHGLWGTAVPPDAPVFSHVTSVGESDDVDHGGRPRISPGASPTLVSGSADRATQAVDHLGAGQLGEHIAGDQQFAGSNAAADHQFRGRGHRRVDQ